MRRFPRLFRIRQHFERPRLNDLPQSVRNELATAGWENAIQAGQSVAIAVGSRGIANIAVIVKAVVDAARRQGAEPFIVPAMGSHGGATSAGQAAVLQEYGICEATMGCPVRSQMETEILCQTEEGIPVHFDALARRADHLIVVNRVKPHTRFVGDIESGLLKMLLIGLGKHAGASVYHQAIQTLSFTQILRSVTSEILRCCPVRFGLAIIENAYDETAKIRALRSEQFLSEEPALLRQARQWMPRLPFDRADLLIVDRFGKDISGAGIDTNVVGRKYNDHVARQDETPKIHHIYLRSLSAASQGNATGIGISEFCRSRIVEAMNREKTWVNCLTGGHATAAMVPMHWPTDREVLTHAASQCGLVTPEQSRWMWIRDTLHLAEVMCSEVYWDEAAGRNDLEILSEPKEIDFDGENQLFEAFGA